MVMHNIRFALSFSVIASILVASANASIQFFDNRSDFDAATSGFDLQTEINPAGTGGSFENPRTTPLGIEITGGRGLQSISGSGYVDAVRFSTFLTRNPPPCRSDL